MERKRESGFWLGFFLGGVIAAVLMLMMGTKEGKRFAKILKGKIEDYLKDIEMGYEDKKEIITEKVEQVKEQVAQKIEEVVPHKKVVEIQEKGRAIAEQIGQNFFTKQGKTQN